MKNAQELHLSEDSKRNFHFTQESKLIRKASYEFHHRLSNNAETQIPLQMLGKKKKDHCAILTINYSYVNEMARSKDTHVIDGYRVRMGGEIQSVVPHVSILTAQEVPSTTKDS